MNYCIEPANATKGLYETLQMTCNVFDIELKKGGMTKAAGIILQIFFRIYSILSHNDFDNLVLSTFIKLKQFKCVTIVLKFSDREYILGVGSSIVLGAILWGRKRLRTWKSPLVSFMNRNGWLWFDLALIKIICIPSENHNSIKLIRFLRKITLNLLSSHAIVLR